MTSLLKALVFNLFALQVVFGNQMPYEEWKLCYAQLQSSADGNLDMVDRVRDTVVSSNKILSYDDLPNEATNDQLNYVAKRFNEDIKIFQDSKQKETQNGTITTILNAVHGSTEQLVRLYSDSLPQCKRALSLINKKREIRKIKNTFHFMEKDYTGEMYFTEKLKDDTDPVKVQYGETIGHLVLDLLLNKKVKKRPLVEMKPESLDPAPRKKLKLN